MVNFWELISGLQMDWPRCREGRRPPSTGDESRATLVLRKDGRGGMLGAENTILFVITARGTISLQTLRPNNTEFPPPQGNTWAMAVNSQVRRLSKVGTNILSHKMRKRKVLLVGPKIYSGSWTHNHIIVRNVLAKH